MIGYIKGKVIYKNAAYLILENNGVGYKVFVPNNILEKDTAELALYTYLQVREDALNLFGFETQIELSFFEMLTSVSGVGPKMGLAVLAAGDTDTIKQAIVNQDIAIFTRISGVGKKTAERIVLELKEKISETGFAFNPGVGDSSEIFSALEGLGYSRREISEVAKKLDHSLSQEEKLRQALKMLSK
jgi:Holliday junction DNA helicase RuvA